MHRYNYTIKYFVITIICILYTIMYYNIAYCYKYAILVGISNYPLQEDTLYGPANDVYSMKDIIMRKYGFDEHNIRCLVNSEATKVNFIKYISDLIYITKPNDFILIYFSGHGLDTRYLNIGDSTGAIVPYDFNLRINSYTTLTSKLITGKYDLKPILSKLDQDRTMLVIFDACFSGNTVRSLRLPNIIKTIHSSLPPPQDSIKGLRLSTPYPYKNIIYISASDQREPAADLLVSDYDYKSHGALTSALLEGLEGPADTNQNGVITYEELYQFALHKTQKYSQTPQLLHNTPLSNEVFSSSNTVFHQNGQAISQLANSHTCVTNTYDKISQQNGLQLKISNNIDNSLIDRLRNISELHINNDKFDIYLEKHDFFYNLSFPNGDTLCKMSISRPECVESVIRKRVKVNELINMNNPKQDFNVWLTVGDSEGRTVFFEGEKIDFTIQSEATANLIMLSIDPYGNVYSILPKSSSDIIITKNRIIKIAGLGKVDPPFGTEFIKIFAFKNKLNNLSHYASYDGVLDPTEGNFAELIKLIKDRNDWAETNRLVVTMKQ